MRHREKEKLGHTAWSHSGMCELQLQALHFLEGTAGAIGVWSDQHVSTDQNKEFMFEKILLDSMSKSISMKASICVDIVLASAHTVN